MKFMFGFQGTNRAISSDKKSLTEITNFSDVLAGVVLPFYYPSLG